MKTAFSLKKTWAALILFAVIAPVTIVMIWYGQNSYSNQLNSALTIKRQANESLRNQIESEIRRFKTLLKNKSDPLSFLVDKIDNPDALKKINTLLGFIIEREPTIKGAMILSTQADVIAVIEPELGLSGDELLSTDVLNATGKHWGFNKAHEHPEVVIPSLGKPYISSPKYHEDFVAFYIAVPIGQPAKAVLIAEFDVEKLWLAYAYKHGIELEKNRDYILDHRGALITGIHGSDYKPGDIMTHLPIAHTALTDEEWPAETSYDGAINQPVFGTLTSIPALNWTLISEVSVASITQPIWESLFKIFLLTLLGMIIFVWFVLYLVSKTLKPIQQACDAIDHVTRGDYQFILEPCGIRELDVMTTGFSSMAQARQDAENLLREREQNLAITLNSIGDAVITTDAEGNVTRMNPVAEQLTGWSFEEAGGQPLKTIFPIIDATTRKPIENPVEKVIASGETVYLSNHTTLIAKDGTEYQIADSAAPIRDNDQILGMVLVFNDVTEQYQLRQAATKSRKAIQESEQRLADAQRMTHIGNWELDLATNQLDWSEEIYHIFEIDSGKFGASYEAFLDSTHPDDRERVSAAYTESLRNKTAYSIKHRLRMTDGRIKHVQEHCETFYDDDGNPMRSTGTVQDITEQVSMEEQLRRSQKMDALGKLTGGIAHDYNNLLGIIMGYAEQLNDQLTHEPKLAKYTQGIQYAAERGARLTQKLLGFSRHKAPVTKIVDIHALLSEQRLMLERILTARIKLVYELADGLWPVELDSGDLEDAILNMSINAMHAMESGGQLTLRTRNEQFNDIDARLLHLEAGDYVLLSITDTGCGIDAETKDNIFDPFFSTKGKRGTGLGLSQVYGFIERSGGAIKVYSEPGHGSRFALYFPRSHKSDIDTQAASSAEKQNLRGHETLLVVDDEAALVELAQDILTAQGYRVLTANDGGQALLVLEKEAVDLIISDVIMPNMDGYQLAARVQQDYPHIKIQMVSGFSDDRHNNMADDSLHQHMLYKPYAFNSLLERVRGLLDDGNEKNAAQSNASTKTSSNNQLAGRTILVMDDEEDVRELFQLNLERLGCNSVPASNGNEAIALYQQSLESGKPINAVILDLSIPGSLGGKEVATRLLAMDPNAKIIVASGHSESPEMTHYQDYGFQGALEKNFNREEMKQVLEEVLASD
jgi:PAS domain S-box-containing protein